MCDLKADKADLEIYPDVIPVDSEQSDWEEAVRRAMAAEQRVEALEAAIHAECRCCAQHNHGGRHPADCTWHACPLWPYRPGARDEEAS